MDNTQLLQFGSELGNVIAYDPSKPLPPGFQIIDRLTVDSATGLKVTTIYNQETGQIGVAIAGTNDFADVGGYPSLYLGYDYNMDQVDRAVALFNDIRSFAEENNATVVASGHSFGGLFVDIAANDFGFQGVKWDGVGGSTVVNDTSYQARLTELGIASTSGGSVISVGVNGFLGFGGGAVEYFGQDLQQTTYCEVTTDRSLTSAALNFFGTAAGGLAGWGLTKLLGGIYSHNSDSINAGIQTGQFSCTWDPTPVTSVTYSPEPDFSSFLGLDYSLSSAYGAGWLSNDVYNYYNDWASNQLLSMGGSSTSPYFTWTQPTWNPIGAFYESRSAASDNATSIADKTPVLQGASGMGIDAAALAARDANQDGKLSGDELAGLTAWADANENGIAEAGEVKSLADAGIASIRDTDYGFYTRGNGRAAALPVAALTKPAEAAQPIHVDKTQAVPASNFRSLRDSDNIYYVGGGYIAWSASQVKINYNNKSYLIGTDGGDNFDINYYAAYNGTYFNLGLITNFLAGGGDDVMGGSTRNDMLWGGTGNDVLFGYAGDDKVYGEEGNDELQGNEGNDYLDGGIGDDTLFGQVGNDVLNGGDGNDLLVGFTGNNEAKQTLNAGETDNDTLYGGKGLDSLYGGLGDDTLDGGDDADLLMGDAGNDMLFGGNGNDELNGGYGNDLLVGEVGDDKMFGHVGNDTLWGDTGNDILVGFTPSNDAKQTLNTGETDNDTLYGGAGVDNLYGGWGDDTLDGGDDNDYVLGDEGNDLLFGGAGNDELQGGNGNDRLLGEAGNDNLFGQVGDDTLWGGDGDDLLVGFTGSNEAKQTLNVGETDNDTLYGGNGNDLMLGGLGDDLLHGEADNDELQGGAGNDMLYGGEGDDRLFGQAGNDILYGGDGNDLIVGFTADNEAKQTLDAGEADDWLYGGAGNDTLLGGVGSDYLDGGAGADTMEGGLGDDTYIVNSVNDSILERADEGYDTVISSANYILNSGIEELRLLEGFDIHGTGNALDNRIIGNSRDNILDGVTGADVMIGGAGNDTYYVDNAGDQTIELVGEGVDTVQTTVSHALADNVENLILLDFAKAEKGLVDGQAALVYGYPKANELDYMQGDAVPDFLGTCALTSIANLLTQADRPTSEAEVVQLAAENGWAVTDPTLSPYVRGGSNFAQQQAILDSYGIRNNLIAGYNEQGVANLIRSGRGVILAVNAGVLWSDAAYAGDSGVNHVVTITGAVYGESDGALLGFYIADSGRRLVSDMTRFVDIDTFREAAQVPNAYAIYTKEALKLWNEDIGGTGNELSNVLVGNRGDNVLSGLAGNDTLQGGGGNDTLIGGAGSDTYLFGRGDGCDVIADGCAATGETDVLSFGPDIAAEQLWFQQMGDDLKISVIGSNDNVAIQGWYATEPANHLQQFSVAGGHTLLEADVQNLVSAMAAFAPPQAGQTTLPDAYQEQLQPVLAANWR